VSGAIATGAPPPDPARPSVTARRPASPWRTALLLIGVFCAFLFLRVFAFQPFRIPSGSMIPSLQPGDHLFANKLVYRFHPPARGDVVIFPYPREPSKDFVKRVVGVAGDTVEIRDGALVLNGVPVDKAVGGECSYQDLDEENVFGERRCVNFDETLDGRTFRVYRAPGGSAPSFAPVTVGAGQLYVLGDNRDNAHDSRYWGTVPVETVKGRAGLIWWSSGPRGLRGERLFTFVH